MSENELRLPDHMMPAMHRLDDAFKKLLPNICVALGGGHRAGGQMGA